MPPEKYAVRVRMYRQGLGDCFLLTFKHDDGEAHVLIDCGVLTGTDNASVVMQRVAGHILATTNKHLHALVATHEHWDHVSGFAQADNVFEDLAIDEVWLAWTESPTDEIAQDLANRKQKAAETVEKTLEKLQGLQGAGPKRSTARLQGLMAFHGEVLGAANRKTTRSAFAWIKGREAAKGSRMSYHKPGATPFGLKGVPGLKVYPLAPPRDLKLLRKSDPSKKDPEVYELGAAASTSLGFLAAVGALDDTAIDRSRPFDRWFSIDKEEAKTHPFFAQHYLADDWQSIEHDWLSSAESLALKLDSDTNNTCLVLAFELEPGGRVLLFPGDAQVGNWLSWAKVTWDVEENGKTRHVTSADLLSRTVLYKVGHHGSHNATLRQQGLELMTSEELVAMIPVNEAMAKAQEWEMPLPSLLTRLKERTQGRVIQLDAGMLPDPDNRLSETRRKAFEDCVEPHDAVDALPGWIDYYIV
jgi:beta-lactamase superfamily II metal-dependent hydrolase